MCVCQKRLSAPAVLCCAVLSTCLQASFLEIYNDSLRDLLDEKQPPPRSRQAQKTSGSMGSMDRGSSHRTASAWADYKISHDEHGNTEVSNLTLAPVSCMDDVRGLMARAEKQRSVGCTARPCHTASKPRSPLASRS